METKLKTLKDLDKVIDIEGSVYLKQLKVVYLKQLKAEAVKRAKYFIKKMMKARKVGSLPDSYYWHGRLEEVTEANNLTEEDLK